MALPDWVASRFPAIRLFHRSFGRVNAVARGRLMSAYRVEQLSTMQSDEGDYVVITSCESFRKKLRWCSQTDAAFVAPVPCSTVWSS